MTSHQILQLLLQFFTLGAVISGLVYSGYQLKLLRRQYHDLHEWNRRKAAQDAIDFFVNLAEGNKLINEVFNFLESNDPISLVRVQDECTKHAELRSAIHRLLNFLEGLAIGTRHAVLDESLIRDAFIGVMDIVLLQFSEYIQHRRRHSRSDAWEELETTVKHWQAQKMLPPRPFTGAHGAPQRQSEAGRAPN
jgi:hypothetical protein